MFLREEEGGWQVGSVFAGDFAMSSEALPGDLTCLPWHGLVWEVFCLWGKAGVQDSAPPASLPSYFVVFFFF